MENNIKRGSVYYLRDTRSYGHELAAGRPILILSADEEIDKNYVVTAAFLTTAPKGYLGSAVELMNMRRPSYVLCNQIGTFDKERICEHIYTLTDDEMKEVEETLLRVLSLPSYEPVVDVTHVVEEIEPVFVENRAVDEIRERLESELYQKLYTKAMADLVEARYKLDELQLKYDREFKRNGHTPIKEVAECMGAFSKALPTAKKETIVDVEALKQKMTTPNDEMDVEVVEPVDRDEEIPEKLKKSSGGNKKKKKTLTLEEIDEILIKNGFSIINNGKAKLAKDAKPINVNTATRDDFKSLGMGNHVVGALIKHRTENGNFESFEDLLLVKYFGPAVARTYGSYLEI